MEELNSVQKFYKDKTIFITGGSGFMGKVLIEKLLYSCSDVKELIVLMRPKRWKSANQRREDFAKSPCFRRILEEKPEMMAKITVVSGEISQPFLGLSQHDIKYIIEKANLIFHTAASVKLAAPLRSNILTNLTATKNVIDLAKMMKNLILMVHTSTAFCNVDHEIVDEKVYDFPHRPMDLIRSAEWMTEAAMAKIQKDVLLFHPNTYTYTKRLAEILVRDEFNTSNLPVCIVRPSIVTPSCWEPVNGWIDSMNGPAGLSVAAGKGILRTILVNKNARMDAIPVDFAVNGLIMFAKKIGTDVERPKEIPVCNLTTHDSSKVTYGQVFEQSMAFTYDVPFLQMIWFPRAVLTQSKIYYVLNVFLFQWIPAYFIDFLLLIFRIPRFMISIQKKISQGMDAMAFFTMNNWNFKSDNFHELINIQDRNEWEMFFIDCRNVGNNQKYIVDSMYGTRRYCAKDSLKTIPKARLTLWILWIIDLVCKVGLFYWLFAKILLCFGILSDQEEMKTEVYERVTLKNLAF